MPFAPRVDEELQRFLLSASPARLIEYHLLHNRVREAQELYETGAAGSLPHIEGILNSYNRTQHHQLNKPINAPKQLPQVKVIVLCVWHCHRNRHSHIFLLQRESPSGSISGSLRREAESAAAMGGSRYEEFTPRDILQPLSQTPFQADGTVLFQLHQYRFL